MSELKTLFSVFITGATLYYLVRLGAENPMYWVTLPPLFFALFALLSARIPRTREAHEEAYQKSQINSQTFTESEQ